MEKEDKTLYRSIVNDILIPIVKGKDYEYELYTIKSLSVASPEGYNNYIDKRAHLIIEEISKESLTGKSWVVSGYPHNEELLKLISRNAVLWEKPRGEENHDFAVEYFKKDISVFFKKYWLLQKIYGLKEPTVKEQRKPTALINLFKELGNYFVGLDFDDFERFINGKPFLKEKNERGAWISSQYCDAMTLCDHFGFAPTHWMTYFYFKVKPSKKLTIKLRSKGTRSELTEILEKYLLEQIQL